MSKEKEKPLKKNICVLFGGVSPEHEVSLRSAAMVLDVIDRDKYRVFPVGIRRDGRWLLHRGEPYEIADGSWETNPGNTAAFLSPERNRGLMLPSAGTFKYQRLDCIFPVLHGENGEDGTVQGLFHLAGIPFVGPGVCASAAAMDKTVTKLIADSARARQARYVIATAGNAEEAAIQAEKELGLPVFVKPAATGSSVGVSKVKTAEELMPAIKSALKFGSKAIIEEYIPGRELEVAILGNNDPLVSRCAEIISGGEFYDYNGKYACGSTAQTIVPADIPAEAEAQIREMAKNVYMALGCTGLSRADFFLKSDGTVVFNEINTIPGFTSISMYPRLIEESGISNTELVTRLIDLAMAHGREQK